MSNVKNSTVRTAIREMVGLYSSNNHVDVILIDGEMEPELRGVPGGWFTKSGEKIEYPNAYRKVGRSNMVYFCDTRRIIVGQDWVFKTYGVRLDENYKKAKIRTSNSRIIAENEGILEARSEPKEMDDYDSNRAIGIDLPANG